MAHPAESRVALRAAYLDGLALEIAAVKVGVPVATARRWKYDAAAAGDDWDKMRNAQMLAAGGGMEQTLGRVVSMVITQAEATVRVLETNTDMSPLERTQAIASLTDSLGKASAVAARLMPQTSQLAIAMDVIKRLAAFVAKQHPAHAEAFGEILEPFGDEIAKAYA